MQDMPYKLNYMFFDEKKEKTHYKERNRNKAIKLLQNWRDTD